MFYYFGRKKRLAKLYPDPECDIIVEPFAGSAAYSLYGDRWERYVIISDLDDMVYRVWLYLQQVSVKELKKLPTLYKGDRLSSIKLLCPAERWLLAYHSNVGCTNPESINTVTEWGATKWQYGKKYIIGNVHKVRHWLILNEHYIDLPDILATWFIDPPYEESGSAYRINDVDYDELADWSLRRWGQIIVCENEGANWLDFEYLSTQVGIKPGLRSTNEVVYIDNLEE